jgi:hypothetical protein
MSVSLLIRLSVRMIQLENRWTDVDKNLVWNLCAFQFPAVDNTNFADERTCYVRSTLAPLTVGSCMVIC